MHTQNQVRVAHAVQHFKDEMYIKNPSASPQDIQYAVETHIETILREAEFDPRPYRAKGDGKHDYGKYLIYSDANHGAPFCFQFFCFDALQKTPIHNHPCECTSYVVCGEVRERDYQQIDDTLVKTRKEDREAGSRRAINLAKNDPHSIKNRSGAPAGTLHVYRMDGDNDAAAVLHLFDAPQKCAV